MIGYILSVITAATVGLTEIIPVQESFNGRREAIKRENMTTGVLVGMGGILIYLLDK